ncbi:class II glutamine amidotransferase [Glutamicibacter sp.]|uniref:class II glutamine amidotransferase n=1 Tax=Glutamicibacter sp. TaxID=1931995 RepID=UPI003D6B78B7
MPLASYLGSPIDIADILVRPTHSLIDQRLHARQLYLPLDELASGFADHAFPTNGDGLGMAWAGYSGMLGQYRQIGPASDSQNLRHLAAQIALECILAHVCAAPGRTIAEQNCHPFVDEGWMFQHNGLIPDFDTLKREPTFDVDPSRYPMILGNADTEVCFYLVPFCGLARDPVAGLSRMVARVKRARAEHGIEAPFRATICASDGQQLVVLGWVSPEVPGEVAPSLYHAAGPAMLLTRDGTADQLPQDAQLVVSEPLELHWSSQTWHEVPSGTVGVMRTGQTPVFAPADLHL